MQKAKQMIRVKEKDKPKEIESGVDVLQTWGTGSYRRTMSINIKKRLYIDLGWQIGDFLKIAVDYPNKRLIITKMEMNE